MFVQQLQKFKAFPFLHNNSKMEKLKEVTLWTLIGYGYRYGTKSIFYIVGFLKHKCMGFLIIYIWMFVPNFAIFMPLF